MALNRVFRAVRFQKFHLGSGSGVLGVKEPRSKIMSIDDIWDGLVK